MTTNPKHYAPITGSITPDEQSTAILSNEIRNLKEMLNLQTNCVRPFSPAELIFEREDAIRAIRKQIKNREQELARITKEVESANA